MAFQTPSFTSTVFFMLVLLFVLGAYGYAVIRVKKSALRFYLTLVVYIGLLSLGILTGKLEEFPFPLLPVTFFIILLVASYFGFSRTGAAIGQTIPLTWLIGFQGFRLPLELILHEWVQQGSIPETMTWSGQNWDVVSGILAIVAAPVSGKFPWAIRVANVIGFGLLLNVIRVAMLSSPLPFGWQLSNPLQVAFHLPYAWIGPICVGGALSAHIILTRALWQKR